MPFVQSRPDPRPCFGHWAAPAFKLGRDHPGVVEHQHIALAEHLRQIADLAILERRAAIDHQQPRGIARTQRPQGYAFWWEIEIEQIDAHVPRPS